jgi:hypothetical protein
MLYHILSFTTCFVCLRNDESAYPSKNSVQYIKYLPQKFTSVGPIGRGWLSRKQHESAICSLGFSKIDVIVILWVFISFTRKKNQ